MTKAEFLKEALESGKCPSDFGKMFELQEKYQNLAMSTLREFHRVCIRNSVDYQLAFGSLLGAIRDNGIIPWDYDVDVFVRAEDRKKLIAALEKDLDSGYHFNSIEHECATQGMILRIAPKPYSSLHLHVDVFFLAAVSNDDETAEKESKKLRRAARIFNSHKTPLFEVNPFVHPRGWLQVFRDKLMYMFCSTDRAVETYFELAGKYRFEESKKVVNANCYAGTYFMKTEFLRKTIPYKTAEGEFMIPEKYTEVLEDLFGDYRSYPSLQSRIADTEEHYGEFLKIERNL